MPNAATAAIAVVPAPADRGLVVAVSADRVRAGRGLVDLVVRAPVSADRAATVVLARVRADPAVLVGRT